jgi:hypothetical protein
VTQNISPTFVKTPNWGATQITTGTGSSVAVTVYSGGVNGSKINALMAVSVGTTANFDVQWGVSSGGTLFIHGTASVSPNAGSSDATVTVNLMSNANVPLAQDSDGNPYVILPSSAYTLQAKSPATSSQWATGAAINVIAPSPGDF